MATSLGSVIYSAFRNENSLSMIARQYRRDSARSSVTSEKYMEIPVSTDVFELPLLAFDAFLKMHEENKRGDMIVASLYSCGFISTYKSIDGIMKDVLSTHFDRHLCKVLIPGTSTIYYATLGAVFNEDFTPLMMLSWIMERKEEEGGTIKYHYRKPLLRLSPHPCINREDSLQRFLAGKMLTTTLSTAISTPYTHGCSCIEQSHTSSIMEGFHVKVEIDECPFVIRNVDTPSISVTNESLLQLAADHIDEILQ